MIRADAEARTYLLSPGFVVMKHQPAEPTILAFPPQRRGHGRLIVIHLDKRIGSGFRTPQEKICETFTYTAEIFRFASFRSCRTYGSRCGMFA